MSEQVDAIFENGVFRPIQSVNVPNGEWVSLTVERRVGGRDDLSDIADLLDTEYVEACRRRFKGAPSLEEVRQILGKYKGSLAELIIQERDER